MRGRDLVGFTVMACAILGCAVRISEANIVHPQPGDAVVSGKSPDGRWTIEALSIPADEGAAVLHGAVYRKPEATAAVLYFGGNGFVLSKHDWHVLRIYRDLPIDVVMFDHRGYGASSGDATLDAMLLDGVNLYDAIAQRSEFASRPLIVHGHSMGSFVAGEVARQRTLAGLVLESSATTAEEWAQGFVDRYAVVRKAVVEPSLASKGNAGVVQALDEPVLFVVGEHDATTRSQMTQALYAAAPLPEDRKELLIVSGAGHMDAAIGSSYADAFRRLLVKAQSPLPAR
jgi:uncharacterized protein